MPRNILSCGFTITEVIIVVTILAILSTLGFTSYGGYLAGARDSARVSDLSQLKMTLKSEKQKVGVYPTPGSNFEIVHFGTSNIVAYQGFFDPLTAVNDSSKYPKDPTTGGYYPYSTTKNGQWFQLATINESANPMTAYLDGDYKSVAPDILPSLMLAISTSTGSYVEIGDGITTGSSNGSSNRKKFILNGGKSNLPYGLDSFPVGNTTIAFTGIVAELGVIPTGSSRFRSCQDISEAGAWVGSGFYQTFTGGAIVNTACPLVSTAYVAGTIYSPGDSFSTTLPSGTNVTISVTGSGVGTSYSKADPLCDTNDIAIWDTSGNIQVWAACNVGATVAMNYTDMKFDGVTNDTLVIWSTGGLFQWGNKANLAAAPGNGSTTNRVTDCTASASTYSSGTLFVRSDATAPANDWCVTANNDLWGNTTNTSTARQWPCPSGYHVPTGSAVSEWNTAYNIALGTDLTSSCNFAGTNPNYQLRCILQLPRMGIRTINGVWNSIGTWGYYWSSSPNTTNARIVSLTAAWWVAFLGNVSRALGSPVRCIKD